jgi:hypothetical protein
MYGKVQQLIINHPNVIIFSNERLDGLTESRWKTYDMDAFTEEDWAKELEKVQPVQESQKALNKIETQFGAFALRT